MKKDLLTVKELAAELRMIPKWIQRAYRKEEIPMQWLGRMARVRFHKGSTGNGTERTKPYASSQRQRDTAGRDRRRQPAARSEEKPPNGKTGALVADGRSGNFYQ